MIFSLFLSFVVIFCSAGFVTTGDRNSSNRTEVLSLFFRVLLFYAIINQPIILHYIKLYYHLTLIHIQKYLLTSFNNNTITTTTKIVNCNFIYKLL